MAAGNAWLYLGTYICTLTINSDLIACIINFSHLSSLPLKFIHIPLARIRNFYVFHANAISHPIFAGPLAANE
jgi:hypothetical protein